MSFPITLTIETNTPETNAEILQRIFTEVEALGERDNWPGNLTYLVSLALEEFGLNALTYGRASGLEHLEITIKPDKQILIVEMVDNGPAFDPLTDAPIPDVDAPLESRPIGGLGIYLIRKMVDEIYYRRQGGQNYLTLVTKLRAEQ